MVGDILEDSLEPAIIGSSLRILSFEATFGLPLALSLKLLRTLPYTRLLLLITRGLLGCGMGARPLNPELLLLTIGSLGARLHIDMALLGADVSTIFGKSAPLLS